MVEKSSKKEPVKTTSNAIAVDLSSDFLSGYTFHFAFIEPI